MSDVDIDPEVVERAPARWTPRFAGALAIVALAAAAFAIAFRGALTLVFEAVAGVSTIVSAMENTEWWWRLGIPVGGAFVAGLLAMAIANRAGGGVGDVMEAVALGRVRLSMSTTLVKSLASWSAIVTGGSLGREGPLIQFGGAAGSSVGGWLDITAQQQRVLIAAGTAAGFAAAYNTPLAAIAFVLEVVAGIVVIETIVPALIATVIATALTRAVVGAGPLYGQHDFVVTNPGELAAFAGVALVAAVVAFGFTRFVMLGERVFRRPWLRAPWKQALGGLGAGAIIVFVPQVAGNGFEPLQAILDAETGLKLIAILLVAKCLATTSSVASGSPGGIFTPTMLIGGCTGYLAGAGLGGLGLDVGPPGGYALVGMAAAIAAATHAPFMAAILCFELSGDYAVVLPLVLATAIATAFARTLGRDSIYTAELRARGVAWEPSIRESSRAD